MLLVQNHLSDGLFIAYAIFGIISSGIFILCDLVFIMKPGFYDMDDYIMGSIHLYLDIDRMFIFILQFLGTRK